MSDIFVGEKHRVKEAPRAASEPEKYHTKIEEDIKKVEKPAAREHIPGHTHNPLSSYDYFPDNVDFEIRERQEKIVLFLRKHPITNLRWIAITLVLVLAPLFLVAFPILDFLPSNFQFIAILGSYLVTTAYILENFFSWYFNVYIVTDERIVDIDFYNLIYKEVSDANIDKIQDVTVQAGGAVMALFNYGNVFVQTAAEVPNIEFEKVPKPDKVSRVLRNLILQEEQEKVEGRIR